MYSEVRRLDIGWCADRGRAAFAFQPPRTVLSRRAKPLSIRSVQNCPAVNGLERQLIEIPSPVSIRLRIEAQAGKAEVVVDPQGTTLHEQVIGEFLKIEPPHRWRDPRRPVIQLRIPFFFVTDARCWLVQLPPFLDAAMRRWPGTMIAGRIPAHLWPCDLNWAFEFDAAGRDLSLRAGEPLCYLLAEFEDPHARPNLIEAKLTETLKEWRAGMAKVGEVTQDIASVWNEAERRRPATLLTPVA